ncbi:MAG: cell division protein FtsQ/DivIB [Burkholderiaceae bacterium]|nr:cell division protein FtsQ/DivIB [Burkholderiaceae bacterium]
MWHDIKLLNALTGALIGFCALVLLVAGLWWLAQRPMFALKVITVTGIEKPELRHVNALTVKSTVLPRVQGNFFTVNLDSLRLAFETVPWVRRATVRREWPNRLIVTIEEHQPLGTWGEDGRLLSTDGDVFTANLAEAEEDGKLFDFGGPAGSGKEVASRYQDFRLWFAPLKLSPVAVHLSDRFSWSVRLSNGMTVKLGREQSGMKLKEQVERMIQVYPQLVARMKGRIDSLDLRYPNGLALSVGGQTS